MTDTTAFPFDGEASTDEEITAGPNRRRLLLFIAVGVVVAALIGYLLVGVLFAGSEQLAPGAANPLVPGASRLTPASPTPSPKAAPQSVAAAGRNPFLPLVAPVAAAAPAGGAAAPAGAAPAVPTSAPSSTPGMTTFKVLSVSGNQAVVTIDGKRYTPSTGQAFATTYRLVSTSDGMCADFTKGQTRFGLCEGQTLIF